MLVLALTVALAGLPDLQTKSVVQLGESIHMTNELPAARFALVEELSTTQGFDVLLFEGSAVEGWLAADVLLNAKPTDQSASKEARDVALPFLWRTDPYTRLFEYVRASLRTERPLYVASYDLQPGMGKLRADALPALRRTLSSYLPEPAAVAKAAPLLDLLSDRANGFPNRNPPDFGAMAAAIAAFEAWVYEAAPLVDERFPTAPHGRMLRVLPGVLRAQVELWKRHRWDPNSATFKVFQETRDRLGAGIVLQIKDDVSKNGKALVWAHHVHVFHNTLGQARHSMGSDLKRWLGDKLYTIGTFAGEGACSVLDGEEVTETTLARPAPGSLEAWLGARASGVHFVDFAGVTEPKDRSLLDHRATTRREGGEMPTVPARDFDGAIYVPFVTRPRLGSH